MFFIVIQECRVLFTEYVSGLKNWNLFESKLFLDFIPCQFFPVLILSFQRNGTLPEVHNINTGDTGMQEFGLITQLNGRETLPFWLDPPCNSLKASEGSFFPPRHFTKKDIVHIYDKDLCRSFPFEYKGPVVKHGKSIFLNSTNTTIGVVCRLVCKTLVLRNTPFNNTEGKCLQL